MNCSFNIRYKPRTTRAFTKSDLTVYDSAGNTALNALTVYGKSEVVDGSIKSAGEGWATVDLGTLTWGYNSSSASNPFFYASDINIKLATSQAINENLVCEAYNTYSFNTVLYDVNIDKAIGVNSVDNAYKLVAINTDYTDAATFKSAMSGVLLCYQLADPTQGNAIAIKSDDGTGIDGTMAVFETGTPLYGVSDTVRDVMQWDGVSGEVTKNCGEVDLGTLSWAYYSSSKTPIFYSALSSINGKSRSANMLCPLYTPEIDFWNKPNNDMKIATSSSDLFISNSQYTDPAEFKTAMSGIMLVYELATPTTQNLTSTENASIAGLRTFAPQTHAQNNAQTDMTVDYTIRVPTI